MPTLWALLCLPVLLFPLPLGSTESAGIGPEPLVVATRNVPPFAIRREHGWDGLTIELWTQIAERLGRRFELREMPLTRMLDAVESGSVDLAAAALTITSDREARVDFTHPFISSGLGIAIHQRPGGGWLATMQRVFSSNFLMALAPLLLLLTLIGVMVWLAERRRNPQFEGGPLKGIGSGLWWSAVTMTTVGYGDKAPATLPGRLIAMVWMFASVIIISSFTAAIATALTVDKLDSSISGVDDLYQFRVLTLPGSTSEAFLKRQMIRHRTTPSLPEALDSLAQGDADAVVYDAPVLRYLVATRHPDSLRTLVHVLQRQDYGIALPAGSPLREDVNRELLRIVRSDEWQQLIERYLGPGS
jgi:ABC-type amino acid transport substrate-binding protein